MSQSTPVTVDQAIQLAFAHHRAGRLREAEAIYRQILQVQPHHPDALHLLGVLGLQAGHPAAALELLDRAIAVRHESPASHCSRGEALNRLGRFDEAIVSLRQALALQPQFPEALHNLGITWQSKGDAEQAINCYQQAIAQRPAYGEAYNNLGNLLAAMARRDEAVTALTRAAELLPGVAEVHLNLGNAYHGMRRLESAMEAFRQALRVRPEYPQALHNLASVCHDSGRLEEAEQLYRQAIALQPGFAQAHDGLGNALRAQGRYDEAMACYRQAMSLAPEDAQAHHNYSMTLLLLGDLKNGWREHEYRQQGVRIERQLRDSGKPSWDGSNLNGRTILIYSEQGFGDAIQFVRYVPLVAQRGGRVILSCHEELPELFQTIGKDVEVIPRGVSLPAFDTYCAMLALPLLIGTDSMDQIPAKVPYLRADMARSELWRQRLAALGEKRKVGLVWAGRPDPPGRSVRLAELAPLAQNPGTAFISLQLGEEANQATSPPAGMQLIDWSGELRNFADTAALIDHLDLLISVDTAAAHLAGALGKPVWVLLPFVPDWRWLLERQDSPWYPTMRLFRQRRSGDWTAPIGDIAQALLRYKPSPRV